MATEATEATEANQALVRWGDFERVDGRLNPFDEACIHRETSASVGCHMPQYSSDPLPLPWKEGQTTGTSGGDWLGKLSGYVLTSERGEYTECEHCDGQASPSQCYAFAAHT